MSWLNYPTLPVGIQTGHPLEGPGMYTDIQKEFIRRIGVPQHPRRIGASRLVAGGIQLPRSRGRGGPTGGQTGSAGKGLVTRMMIDESMFYMLLIKSPGNWKLIVSLVLITHLSPVATPPPPAALSSQEPIDCQASHQRRRLSCAVPL